MKAIERLEMCNKVSEECHKIFSEYNKNKELEVADILECLAIHVKMFIVSQVETKKDFYEAFGYYHVELSKNVNEFIKPLKK